MNKLRNLPIEKKRGQYKVIFIKVYTVSIGLLCFVFFFLYNFYKKNIQMPLPTWKGRNLRRTDRNNAKGPLSYPDGGKKTVML